MSQKLNRRDFIQQYMECSELLDMSGCGDDPLYRDLMLPMTTCRVKDGALSERAVNLMGGILGPKAAANAMGNRSNVIVPKCDPRNGVVFGVSLDTATPLPLAVPLNAFGQHGVLLGGTGFGKTNIGAVIKSQIPDRIFFEFIDSKKEGARFFQKFPDGAVLDPAHFYDNPWEPIGDPVTSRLARFEKMAPVARLDDRSWPELPGILAEIESSMPADYPSLSPEQLLVVLERLGNKKEKFNTLASRLRPFVQALGPIGSRVCKGPDARTLFKWICLDYSHQSPLVRHLWEACRIDKRLQTLSEQGHTAEFWCLTFYDELIDFFAKEFTESQPGSRHVSFLKVALSQCRSFGWAFFFCSQYPSQLGVGFAANIGIIVVLRLQDKAEARAASQMLGVGDELTSDIQHLDKGEFFIGGHYFPQPVRGKAPLVDLGEYPKDSQVKESMAVHFEHMKSLCVLSPERPKKEHTISFHDVFPECCPAAESPESLPILVAEHATLMRDLEDWPDEGIAEHYKRLGWSPTKGGRVRNELQAHKFIFVERKAVKKGQKPRDLWRLTEEGKAYLDGLS